MRYVLNISFALVLLFSSSVHSQTSNKGNINQPAKATAQPAPAVSQPSPAASQSAPAANQPAVAKGILMGMVTDAAGKALAASITFEDPQIPALKTDPKTGKYKGELAPGKHTVKVAAQGFEAAEKKIEVKGKAEISADFQLKPVVKAETPAPVKNGPPPAAVKDQPAYIAKINGECMDRDKAGPTAGKWMSVKSRHALNSGDDILVRKGDIEIEIDPKTTVQLKAESLVTYFKQRESIRPLSFVRPDYPTTKIKVTKGNIIARVSPFEISKHFVVFDTPSGVAGVRGTAFSLTVSETGQVTITTSEGQVVMADSSGNFIVDIGSGVQAILKKNEDGSFSIQSPQGQAVAYSTNATFKISAGGALNLDLTPDGKVEATVPAGSSGSVNVQIGNIQTNLSDGQGVALTSERGGTTVESTGTGTVFTTVDGQNVVSLDNGEKVLVKLDQNGTTIEGVSGAPTVTGSDGQPRDLQSGETIKVDNTNQVTVGNEPCTPSVSPYKPCP